eukprot:GEMP01020937.1.p1 GENE.GEMP01020937.1~~GEMP01020937.1.p1  ORF type:complete len:649 (+),score=230.44 GEMP01020937.1:211-2157(+)
MKILLGLAAFVVAVTPVQKVVSMLEDMKAKGQASNAQEQQVYQGYAEWVDDQVRDKNYELETLRNTKASLEADINKAEADVNTLTSAIHSLDADIAEFEQETAAATKQRGEEKTAFEKINRDYVDSIAAIGNAINVLQQQNFDREQAASLLQSMSKFPEARMQVTAFLESADISHGAPEVSGYEFQSGGIIGLLKKLQRKFREEMHTVSRDESNAQHAYDMAAVHRQKELEVARNEREQKDATRAKRRGEAGEFKGELVDTNNVLAATLAYVDNVKTTFASKTRDYNLNQKVRHEELEALSLAIEILSSNAVKGSAEKHLPTMIQKHASFIQLRSSHRSLRSLRAQKEHVATFIAERAARLHSKVLQIAAIQVAQGGPFHKVAKLISDLIARLESEAAAEADHKQWCNQELKDNKLTREEKTEKVDQLQVQVENLSAKITQLAQEIGTLNEQEASLRKAVKDYTAERTAEHKLNEATIKDAKAAQTALASALEVLKAFYDKAGASFAQQVPEMARYRGQQDSKKGVVGMLEVIASDFARLEADTSAAENQAQREFEEFKAKAEVDIEAKHKDAFDKTMLKDRKEHTRKLTKKDLRALSDELDASNAYYDQLKPQCLEVHVSYEERVRLREEEIQALQQAYAIFDQKEA